MLYNASNENGGDNGDTIRKTKVEMVWEKRNKDFFNLEMVFFGVGCLCMGTILCESCNIWSLGLVLLPIKKKQKEWDLLHSAQVMEIEGVKNI